ncbi:extracellular solute-binding protein [Paenibacillus yanchengensis]|uniref:Extracellular solute-binding protein n=1 Tax=Paenibacillus yanchengensis TaxID=2035833 RepID=A0ABW4YNF2_9BACL
MSKRKIVTLLMLMLIFILTVMGCSSKQGNTKPTETKPGTSSESKNTEKTNEEKASEGVASTINLDKKYDIKWFQWGPRDIHEDDAIIKFLNEKFNVNIKVERILAKEYLKNLELKIAAGDMPDVFKYPVSTGSHIYSQLNEDDFLLDFADYASKYELKALQSYIDRPGTEEFREENGVFQLPVRRAGISSVFVVRQDWLDELKLEKPKTMDEFKNMLQAFKDNKMGGDNTVPMTFVFGAADFLGLSTGYTGVNTWGKVDNKWTYESIMPQYKAFLQYANELYKEGLVDRELFTSNENQAKSKFVSGKTGVIMSSTEKFVALEKDMAESNKEAKLALIMPMPEGPAAVPARVSASYTDPFVAIKKERDEDFLARVAAIIDFTHSEEGIKMLNFGIEGVHYNMENGKKVKTELYDRDILPSIGHLLAMTTDYSLSSGDVEGILKENYDYSQQFGIAPPFTALSYGEVKDKVSTIEKKNNDWVIEFVTGSKDIDQYWDQYIKEMNDAGLITLTEAVQKNRQ